MRHPVYISVDQSRGKALFDKCAENNQDTNITENKEQPELIPGVDFEKLEVDLIDFFKKVEK